MIRRSLILGAVFALAACGSGNSGQIAGAEYENMAADQVMFDVRHYITANGIRQALLYADTAYFYEDSARIDLRVVRLILFHSSGQEAAELTSEKGELQTRTEAMSAYGNVVLITREDDRRIETEELHYDPQLDRIWSDVATTMTENGRQVRGDGFTSDGKLTNVKVIRPSGQVEGMKLEF